MKDVYIKDKFNRDIAAIEFKSPIHHRVIMTKHNFFTHIANSHPEINLDIMQAVLEAPEKVYEVFKKDKLFYYEKTINGSIFIVALGERVSGDYKKVMTAFQLTDHDKNRFNRVHIIYDSDDIEVTEEELLEQLERDEDYFKKIFEE